jgi:hypothetical protein
MAFNLHITQIMAKPERDEYSADAYADQTITYMPEYTERQDNSGFASEMKNQKTISVDAERKYPIRIFTIQHDA